MALSYLSQDDIADWAPWLWVILAYKWTRDQGKTVPSLALDWRTGVVDLDAHARRLLQIWMPTAITITVEEESYAFSIRMAWREARLTAWLQAMRDPQTPRETRRKLARQYAQWLRRVQGRIHAQTNGSPWLDIALRGDAFQWAFDADHYGDYWTDPALIDFVHWLQSLASLIVQIPEVTG